MQSRNIHRLLTRLHVPQVALRATKEELLISLGAVATLRTSSHAMTTSPTEPPPPAPGVLGQRVAKLSWQSSHLKETRILISAAGALSWSGVMLPAMYDGICSSLLASSASAVASLQSRKSEVPVLVACIVQTIALALGDVSSRSPTAPPIEGGSSSADGDTARSSSDEATSRYMSLTLQHLLYHDLPLLDPSGSVISTLVMSSPNDRSAVEVLLAAVQSLTLDVPCAAFVEWLAKVVDMSNPPSASVAETTALPGNTLPSSAVVASLRNILLHLPDAESYLPARLTISTIVERIVVASAESAVNSSAETLTPLWSSQGAPLEPQDERARLLMHIRKGSMNSDAAVMTHEALSSLLKWCSKVDLRDEVAADQLCRLTLGWIDTIRHTKETSNVETTSSQVLGLSERAKVHELLFFARRTVALRSTCRALEALLSDSSFIGSDARHQSTALAQLAAPDHALLEWERGVAPQSSGLFTMLNDAHTYSLDQLAAVIFLFPHRSSELQELCGRVRGKLRDAQRVFDPTHDKENNASSMPGGKGLGMLAAGLARCNWSVEPLVEELFLQTIHLATSMITTHDASSIDIQDVAAVAHGVFSSAAPLLGHWQDQDSAARIWRAVDELASAVVDATTPHVALSHGALGDSCLQDILRTVGAYIHHSRGRRAKEAMAWKLKQVLSAPKTPENASQSSSSLSDQHPFDEIVAKGHQWFDATCEMMSKALQQQQQFGTLEAKLASLQSVAAVLETMLAWDRGHERLLDVCAGLLNTAWGLTAASPSTVDDSVPPIPTPLQQASAAVLVLQARFNAPELEMSVERLMRVYHKHQPHVDAIEHSPLTAALIFASVKTGHAVESTLLVNRLASSAPASSVKDLIIEAEATLQTLKLVSNHSYVRHGTFEGPREAIVGHALDLAERLSLHFEAAQHELSGQAKVERIVNIHARLLTSARVLCNAPNDTNADESLTRLADRAPFFSSQLISELLSTPVVSTVALANAACERMASLSWTWTPSEFCAAISGVGETLRGNTTLVHQVALSSAADHAVDHVECFFQGSSIARMLLGFAKSHIISRSLFNVFSTRLKKRPLHAAMSLPDMSCALQAFGIAKFVDKAMFDVLGKRILAFEKMLTPADVTLTTCAFSRTMLLHHSLYRGLGNRGAEIMGEMPSGAASALIAAFGHVGVRHQELGEAAVTKQKLDELTALEAANMLVGLWQMNYDDAGDHFDLLANRIAALEGEGLEQKELVGVCSVMHDLKWRHPALLITVALRSAQLMTEDAPSATRLSGESARAVLDTLGTFGIHHAAARSALSEAARAVSRESVSIPEDERRLLLSGGL
jgi:hypothetical protein